MVEIKWTGGRTGNDLFQYIFARLIAHKNKLKLVTEWPHDDFIKATPHEPGDVIEENQELIQDLYWDQHDSDWFNNDYRKKRILVSGFFQHHKYYDQDKDLVKSFFDLEPVEKRASTDVVFHYRLTDYYKVGEGGSVIHPTWVAGILLNKLKFNPQKNNFFIVTDDPTDKIFNRLQRYNPMIIHQSPKEDFNFIRSFDTILCGNSSFSWWATYLSEAKKIFTFSKWINEPRNKILRLAQMRGALPVMGNYFK